VTKICAFCQKREGARKVEIALDTYGWICGECWDEMIGDALRQASTHDKSKDIIGFPADEPPKE
jgi:hypothetical protein